MTVIHSLIMQFDQVVHSSEVGEFCVPVNSRNELVSSISEYSCGIM